jgi:hypothetical protein
MAPIAARQNLAYRFNLFRHIGTTSTLRDAAQVVLTMR